MRSSSSSTARTLDRPVNYGLVRVVPPSGVEIDPTRRPFVIVDPRAGHGPGIGGFKADSEIGVAFKAGHPCYFVGFLPDPMPGQTIEDIARAEAVFLEKVIALHPEADGKPCVIGNCQAGWAIMMLAAMRPELFGPIIIAGSPLSYWAGRARQESDALHRRSARRQLADRPRQRSRPRQIRRRLAGAEFRESEPRQHAVDQAVQSLFQDRHRGPRYLGFERWWGGHVNLNAEEIQFIVDELFIGNNLAAGRIQTSDGTAIDLRNIRSPIVVFCSKGDNITPPQQALGWILDLYESVDEIRSYGQTIVYTIHESVGHLGIFVSGGVAKKEHGEFSSNIDLIDTLPPGLYEAVFDAKAGDTANPDLAAGNWVMRCEARTLDDIRALGGNDAADERRFATAARVSEINLALYRTFAQPMVRALVSSPMAEWMQRAASAAAAIRAFLRCQSGDGSGRRLGRAGSRRAASPSTPTIRFSRCRRTSPARSSRRSTRGATRARRGPSGPSWRCTASPALQAAVGIDPAGTRSLRKCSQEPAASRAVAEARIAELKSRIAAGGSAAKP